MTNEQQALLDMPIWLVILLAVVGGVSGEMWRADKEGARGWSLLRRLALRSGACMICGVSAIMLLYAAGLSIWAAVAEEAPISVDNPSDLDRARQYAGALHD